MPLGLRDTTQVSREARHHLDKLAFIDIGSAAVHGAQHLFGHDRGARDGKVWAASSVAHGISPNMRDFTLPAFFAPSINDDRLALCAPAA
jgi:hypothetical protein